MYEVNLLSDAGMSFTIICPTMRIVRHFTGLPEIVAWRLSDKSGVMDSHGNTSAIRGSNAPIRIVWHMPR